MRAKYLIHTLESRGVTWPHLRNQPSIHYQVCCFLGSVDREFEPYTTFTILEAKVEEERLQAMSKTIYDTIFAHMRAYEARCAAINEAKAIGGWQASSTSEDWVEAPAETEDEAKPPDYVEDEAKPPEETEDKAKAPEHVEDIVNVPEDAEAKATTPEDVEDEAKTPEEPKDEAKAPEEPKDEAKAPEEAENKAMERQRTEA